MDIVFFSPEFGKDFKQLNLDWLEEFFWVEPHDNEVLSNPKSYIIDKGGFVFFVIENGQVLGTAAFMNEPHGWELSKMAIAKNLQGRGIGRKLLNHCIDFAKQKNWPGIMLYSNTKLKPAINLYRSVGFEEIPLEKDTPYERADIKMELVF
ncbi:GNAT family N-acetyltransferase [Flavobacteriaceae bacterium]|nr:GNAT family N-acetyltransferase [Flavobacteriaceae bacterium]